MNTARIRTALLCTVAIAVVACGLSKSDYQSIDAWLLCDDCLNGEREAVKALGDHAVYTLDEALFGPSLGRVGNKEAQFDQAYEELRAPKFSRADYIARRRANYIAKYQKRAAISLGDIGGPRALAALRRARDAAADRGYRADVVSTIDAVLALQESASFGGTVSSDSARFGDTLRVRRSPGLPWDGDESVLLRGSPLPDSLVVTRWPPDSLAFVAAGAVGNYVLDVTKLGPNAVTQSVPLRIVPPSFQASSPATAPSDTGSFPQTHFLMLPAGGGDTTHYIRIAPAAPLNLTVNSAATGLAEPNLRWLICATQAPIPVPSTSLRGYVVDSHNQPLGGAVVRSFSPNRMAVTAPSGQFELTGLPLVPGQIDVRVARFAFRPADFRVQLGLDSVRLGLVDSGATAATAISRQSLSAHFSGGSCHYLVVGLSRIGGSQLLRLRFTSP